MIRQIALMTLAAVGLAPGLAQEASTKGGFQFPGSAVRKPTKTDVVEVRKQLAVSGGTMYWGKEWQADEYATVAAQVGRRDIPATIHEFLTDVAKRYDQTIGGKVTPYLLMGQPMDLGWAKVQVGFAEYRHWTESPSPVWRGGVLPTYPTVANRTYLPSTYQLYARVKRLPNDIELFDRPFGQGNSRGYRVGASVNDFKLVPGWDDRTATVGILTTGVRVRLFEHADRGGRELVFDKPGLYTLAEYKFDGLVSSLIVEKK